ncbi:MAG: selenocysteine-specific translation elongation factor [Pseudomonadota bacterium]
MIVALAGHVDHGKTALINALTGINTDRLPAERDRGLTIDLGFAYQQQDDEQTLGFVDVPGHERFVHNMVAGINRSQVALLVVAADDGVMPQTREHLDILELLGIEQGVIALNKIDRVDAQRLEVVTGQVRALCAETFLVDAPICPVSAVTGAGLPELRELLLALRPTVAQARVNGTVNVRFAIDRAFSLKGVGTVATGMLVSGSLGIDDELQLFPGQIPVRVRSLRVNDHKAKRAGVGDRIAVNLGGVDLSQVARGHWLHGGDGEGSRTLHIALRQRPGYEKRLRPWERVHLYHGTRHVEARFAPLNSTAAGELLAELDCDEPLLACRGDRLILREHGLNDTIGGGLVLATGAAPGRRGRTDHLARLKNRREHQSAVDSLVAELKTGAARFDALARDYDLSAEGRAALLAEVSAKALGDDLLVPEEQWSQTLATARDAVSRLESARDTQPQPAKALLPECAPDLRQAVLQALVDDGLLQRVKDRYLPSASASALTAAESTLLDRLAPALSETPPPSLGDIGKRLGISADALRREVVPLVNKGALLRFGDNRLLLPQRLRELAALAEQLANDQGPFTARAFRDASGLGRNLAIDVLEYLDSGGFTRRQGDTRTVVGDLSRLLR